MTTYTLEINIDQDDVKHFNSDGYSLCFASGVGSSNASNVVFDVVASTKEVAAHVDITWTEEYAIAASNSTFQAGVTFDVSTDVQPILLGQSYTLPSDWADGTVNPDPSIADTSIAFINQTDGAAAVVYKQAGAEQTWTPIYISEKAPLPAGTEVLTPKIFVTVWFSASAQTGSMISQFDGVPCAVDMTLNQSHKAVLSYNSKSNPNWTIVSNN